jgi:hypothetical protein
MYVYTITDSNETWGSSNTCSLLTVTDTTTGETRTAADFTYFEEEQVEQEELEYLFKNM